MGVEEDYWKGGEKGKGGERGKVGEASSIVVSMVREGSRELGGAR